MKKTLRKAMALFLSLGGTLLALYVGGYWLLFRPLRNLYVGYIEHIITWRLLLNSFIRIFLAATVFGSIWCVFDILAGFFRDEEEEN
ncbi:MAG: hypothetical protein K6F30_09630 [Lachnospiraceae bacterium]|nr:hypothetical protein [Lachnospiraceae bacterium]